MMKIKHIFFLSLLGIFLGGCVTDYVTKTPQQKVGGLLLSTTPIKNVTPDMLLINAPPIFTSEDSEVVANVALENVTGEHSLVWEWYAPNGNLYMKSQILPLSVPPGKFQRTTTTWHRLPIRDEKAAKLTGEWKVRVLLDDEPKLVSKFTVNLEIEELNVDAPLKAKVEPKANYWGLVVGIENYASLPPVEFAARDSASIAEYFTKVIGVPEKNLIILNDAKASRAQIEGYLKSYLPNNIGKNAVLFVYYAGHGLPDLEKGDPYLIPYDGDPLFITSTGYRLQAFYDDIAKLGVKQGLVFVDSCFSGSSRSAKMLVAGARPALLHVNDQLKLPANLTSFASSTGDQISNAYSDKKHGLFTYFLLNGLRGKADANSDSYISLNELTSYVKDEVAKTALRRKNLAQTPVFNKGGDSSKAGDFIITTVVQ